MVSHRLKKEFSRLTLLVSRASLQVIESQRNFQRRRWYRNETFKSRIFKGFFFTIHPLLRNDQANLFSSIYRMTPAKFDELLSIVTPKLQELLQSRQSLERLYSAVEMLAVTLQ